MPRPSPSTGRTAPAAPSCSPSTPRRQRPSHSPSLGRSRRRRRRIASSRQPLARDLGSPAGGGPGAAPLTIVPGGGRDAAEGPGVVRAERRQGSSVRRWVALVAVAATLGVGIVAGFVAAPRAPSGTKELIAFAARPGTRLAAFPTKDGGRLTVAYRPGETRAWIFGSGLTKPSGGRTYELWWGQRAPRSAP